MVLLLMAACTQKEMGQLKNLMGHTIEYQYGESIYHVTFDTDSTLHWQAISGDEAGLKANETYVAEYIDSHQLFITWGEENGTGVSQLLDFEKGIVYNHLLRGRDVSSGTGTIRRLNHKKE